MPTRLFNAAVKYRPVYLVSLFFVYCGAFFERQTMTGQNYSSSFLQYQYSTKNINEAEELFSDLCYNKPIINSKALLQNGDKV